MVPQQIGRYEIKKELGRGGMATVYLATDPRFRRDVAIKVLPRQFTHDPKFLERFEQEAQTIAALEDPAIVPVYDFGEFDDSPYLVMRYMAGGTLRDRIGGKPLDLAETSRILDRLAPALDAAHRKGVIHRDLKPDNVLFDDEDRPYLADFGIARLAEATHTMTIIGTPAYMSPEQGQGKLKLDGRSDIYALGVMLYETLTGQQPYQGETPAGQMLMHILEPLPDVLVANPDLPSQSQAVIDKGMAKDREERYQTAVELAEAVQQLLDVPAEAPELIVEEALEEEPEETVDLAEPETELLAASAAAVTVLETPHEEMEAKTEAEEKVKVKVPSAPATKGERQKAAVKAPTPSHRTRDGVEEGSAKRDGLPAWAWWVAGIAVLILLVFGIRWILNDTGRTPIPTLGPLEMPVLSMPANPALGDVWQRPQDKMRMLYVPPGTFPMGSEDGPSNEEPVHEVTLDGFWIDKTEVTNAQYGQCVDDGECEASKFADEADFNGQEYPVVGVDWHYADAYCRWAGGQLPTEAQWEYAARGPDGNIYPWGEEKPTCSLAKFGTCGGETETVPVDSFPEGASWAGALDMAGNVWEWVNDWYGSDYYGTSPAENPEGPDSGDRKVLRGGGWYSDPRGLRGANRVFIVPDFWDVSRGFRCALPGG